MDITPPTPEQDKRDAVKSLILLLGSKDENAVRNAARALVVRLPGIGGDLHKLAELVDYLGAGPLYTETDMKQVWEAAIKQREQQRAANNVRHVPQFPPARGMATFCYRNIDELNDWERDFITNIVTVTRLLRPLSPKRQAHLEKIYLKLGGQV